MCLDYLRLTYEHWTCMTSICHLHSEKSWSTAAWHLATCHLAPGDGASGAPRLFWKKKHLVRFSLIDSQRMISRSVLKRPLLVECNFMNTLCGSLEFKVTHPRPAQREEFRAFLWTWAWRSELLYTTSLSFIFLSKVVNLMIEWWDWETLYQLLIESQND